MTLRWLASMALALLCAETGGSTTAAAQDAAAQSNELVFALVVNRIFNQGALSLIDDLMAKDVSADGVPLGRGFKALIKDLRAAQPDFKLTVHDVAATEELVLGHVTQAESGTLERRIILLRIDRGWVTEVWSWPDQPPSSLPLGAPLGAGAVSVVVHPVMAVMSRVEARPPQVPGRIGPGFGNGQLWVRPLPLPPQKPAQQLRRTDAQLADSVVRATIQAFLHSIAREPGANRAESPQWSTEIAGKMFGIDKKYVTVAGHKIPAAVLTLIPLHGGTNESKAFDQSDQLQADLRSTTNQARTVDDFKRTISEMRKRKKEEHELEKNERRRSAP